MEIFWYRAQQPTPVGTVVVAHGYAEHHRRFMPLITALQEHGYDVAAYDHEGHGTSPGRRANVDVGRLIATHIQQRQHILREARTPHLLLFGHSMGGLITAASALLEPAHLSGVVLSAPAFVPQPSLPMPLVKAALPVARLLPWLPANIVKKGVLSRDPAVEEAFRDDPLNYTWPVPLRTGVTMTVQGQHALEHAALMQPPLLILHGEDDKLTSPEASLHFVEQIVQANPHADVQIVLLPNTRHELLNEPEGPEHIQTILKWLNAHTSTAEA